MLSILVASLFYIWYDEDNIKHVSTVPKHCIIESRYGDGGKTIAFHLPECQAIDGNRSYAEEQKRISRWNLNNPDRKLSECGIPGNVYVNGQPINEFLNRIKNIPLIGDIYISKMGPELKKASTRATETCKDVILEVKFDQKKFQSGNSNYRYKGISGQRYQYDLSDPYDQIMYKLDLDAQIRDKINPNPEIDLDKRIGEYGGGAEW